MEIIEQAASAANHVLEATPGAIVFLMRLQMLCELFDAMGQNGDLHLHGTGIGIVSCKFFSYFFFGCCVHGVSKKVRGLSAEECYKMVCPYRGGKAEWQSFFCENPASIFVEILLVTSSTGGELEGKGGKVFQAHHGLPERFILIIRVEK